MNICELHRELIQNAPRSAAHEEHSEQKDGQQTRGVSIVASMRPVLQNSSLPPEDRAPAS